MKNRLVAYCVSFFAFAAISVLANPALTLPPPSGDELAKGAFAAYGYAGPAGVEFVRNGDAYRLSNRVGFSLEGRIGGQRMFDAVTLDGKEIGSYGAMLHHADGKRLRWEDTSRTESVRWDAATGRLFVSAACDNVFAVTHAFTLYPDKPLEGRLVLPPGGVWRSPEGRIWMICRAQ